MANAHILFNFKLSTKIEQEKLKVIHPIISYHLANSISFYYSYHSLLFLLFYLFILAN